MIYIIEMITRKNNYLPIEDGVAQIKAGKMAFHYDLEAMYGIIKNNFTDHEICDLSSVAFFRPFPAGLVVKQGTAYKELFRLAIQPLIEAGIADMEKFKYFTKKPTCTRSSVEVHPVALDIVTAPILLFLAGCVAGVSIIIAELIIHKILKRMDN